METQGLKRSAPEEQNLLEDVRAIVVDIEGTTSPISFVKEILFPYVVENVKTYLDTYWDTEECKADVQALRELAQKDKEENVDGLVEIADGEDKDSVMESIVKNVVWQTNADRKTAALKQLQSHMWREAYKSGKITGTVYEDVAPAVREWTSEKRKVFVYSSGSVEAQKMLFGYSTSGNITDLFSGNFDLATGPKFEEQSYSKIASEIDVPSNEVLFLTDLPTEATAASKAGMKTCLVVREGNTPLSEEDLQKFNVIESFTELTSTAGVPAKKQETEAVPPQNGDAEGDVDGAEFDDEDEEEEEPEIVEGDEEDYPEEVGDDEVQTDSTKVSDDAAVASSEADAPAEQEAAPADQ